MTIKKRKEKQEARRKKIATIVDDIGLAWNPVREQLDELSSLLEMGETDAARVFFVLGTQHGPNNDPVEAITRWTAHRLVQLEALEALNTEQKDALDISEDKLVESNLPDMKK